MRLSHTARAVRERWAAFIDGQHRLPTGLSGRLVGERMLRQHRPETEWTLELLELQPLDRVLELGFGAGRGLALAAEQVQQGVVVGIDQSTAMIRSAAWRNHAALQAGRMRLVRADLHALPLTGAQFDKIFSIHTFYFWSDPEQLSAELVGMLAPGGRLVVTLATARQAPGGAWSFWPVHQQVQALAATVNRAGIGAATVRSGPNSRQYNNIALVVQS